MEDATEAEDTLAMEEDAAALESGAELVGLEAGVDAGVEPAVDESGAGVEAGDVLVSVGVADDTGVDEGVAESTAVEEPVNKENNEVSLRDYNSVKGGGPEATAVDEAGAADAEGADVADDAPAVRSQMRGSTRSYGSAMARILTNFVQRWKTAWKPRQSSRLKSSSWGSTLDSISLQSRKQTAGKRAGSKTSKGLASGGGRQKGAASAGTNRRSI